MSTNKIETIIQAVDRRMAELISAERFYTILYEPKRQEISFPWMRAGKESGQPPWTPRSIQENLLPDLLMIQGRSILINRETSSWFEDEHIQYWPDDNPPFSWLGVPMVIEGRAIGALVAENLQKAVYFTDNDLRIMETISRQAANAINNSQLNEQLDIKITNLRILNQVGQQLMKGFVKDEEEILGLIHKSATDLKLDTRNMYIAFYDSDPDLPDTPEKIHGGLRFALAYDEGKEIMISDRPARNGLTEYVIRTKESFSPPDVNKAYQELAQDQIGKIPRSWLGVPMIAEGRVFGVIALRNNIIEQAYSNNDRETLELLAAQAAIAILNMRYFDALQREIEQRVSVEKTAVMSTMAAEFAHKMNNIAGTIPVRVGVAKAELDATNPRDEKILKQLNNIEAEATYLLQAAQEIRGSFDLVEKRIEFVNINKLLETAITRAKTIQINVQNNVLVEKIFQDDLPTLNANRTALLDTFTNLIKNGFEAIEENGTIIITTRIGRLEGKRAIQTEIADSGKGIVPSELSKIFDFQYTTKGMKGLGFGLWRDKVFIKSLGGDINVISELGRGTTVKVTIPIEKIASTSKGADPE